MCTAGDVAMGNNNTTQAENEEEEHEEEIVHDNVVDDEDFPQPETTMAPPLWPPPADLDEDESVAEATQDDFQIGYLQISNDPSSQIRNEEREAEEEAEAEVAHNPPSTETGALAGGANNGHAGSLSGAVVSDGRNPLERIVTVNGMQFHVYGNVSGLELLGSNNPTREGDLDIPDCEEEEEEERRRAATERAIEEANAADAARRAAPIPPEHCAMIVNAMKGINLGGFRPSWADSVPEDEWINKTY
ncbi:unnamed protein product [Calypogeia fissa]